MNVLQKIESEVMKTLEGVISLFTSGKAQAALQEAGSLVTIALPIVQEIDTLAPNKTIEEAEAIAQKYALPFVATAQTSASAAFLTLGTALLQKNLPAAKAGTAVNILQTAIQLAVTASHAG